MRLVYIILFFIVGLFMGSFYTVVGSRLPKREDFVKKRSHCDNCGHNLSFLDMIPIISYIFLRGKCRYCHEKISPLSTYMELFSGILYALSFFVFGRSYELFVALGIVSLLIILSVSDISYYIIPDEILIFFTGYFLIVITIKSGVMSALYALLSGIVLFGFMYIIMLLGNFIFKKESLGGGDIKLMFVIGLVLNPFLGIVVIFLASFIALPISLIILWKKRQNLIPFGPFLLIGFTLIYFMQLSMSTIIEFISFF